MALKPDIPVEVRYHPYFLNPWVPREGMSRDEYLTTKFGSPERYQSIAGRVAAAAAAEGLTYAVDKMTRQPNTLDCHRLILWAQADRQGGADEAAADGPLFHRRRRPVRPRGAGAGRRRRRPGCRHRPARCWRATPTWSGSRPPPMPPRTPASTACRPSSWAGSRPSPARSRRRCSPTRSSRSPPTANSSWPSSGPPPALERSARPSAAPAPGWRWRRSRSRGCARRCAASGASAATPISTRRPAAAPCRRARCRSACTVGLAQRDRLGRRVERDAPGRSRPRARSPATCGSGRANATSSAARAARERQQRLSGQRGTYAERDRAEARDQRDDIGDRRAARPSAAPAGRSAGRAPTQRHQMRRHEQRMQQAAAESADARTAADAPAPASAIASSTMPRRAGAPIAIMRACRGTSGRRARSRRRRRAPRCRPAGQRASRPKAMPARCSRPVAMTKPAE